MTVNIVIMGGNGFIGQKLGEALVKNNHKVTSISRSGKPKGKLTEWLNQVRWVESDILNDTRWEAELEKADWVIHTIGILFENRQKNQTYERFIVEPVRVILKAMKRLSWQGNFLFLSANHAPFFLNDYISAKRKAETLIRRVNSSYVIVYPGIVSDWERPLSMLTGTLIRMASKIPFVRELFQRYDVVSREVLAKEIVAIIQGGESPLTRRRF